MAQKHLLPPTGHAGTEYVKEHTRLLRAYKDKTPLERIALQAIMVMPGLLLQKPHTKAGSKEFNKHLSRRLTLWKAGKIRELLDEARTIQSRLPDQDSRNGLTSHKLNRRFAALVSKGNIHAAISLITEHNKGGVLELTPEVRSALQAKHPKAQPAHPEALLHGELPTINPILFESIAGDTVRRSALATQGSAGPSMADSYIWRRMLVSFKAASNDLCCAVAGVARRLATEHVDPLGLSALLNNRLVPLDKNPGVRPIGIGETLRRIISKSVMTVLKKDIMHAAGVAQVCAGHPAGCEAAIHALRSVFTALDTEAVLLVDADNAFNRLNRAAALQNVQHTCPPLATIAINFYRTSSCTSVCHWWDGTILRGRYHTGMPSVHGTVRSQRHPVDKQMPRHSNDGLQPSNTSVVRRRCGCRREHESITSLLEPSGATRTRLWLLSEVLEVLPCDQTRSPRGR